MNISQSLREREREREGERERKRGESLREAIRKYSPYTPKDKEDRATVRGALIMFACGDIVCLSPSQ